MSYRTESETSSTPDSPGVRVDLDLAHVQRVRGVPHDGVAVVETIDLTIGDLRTQTVVVEPSVTPDGALNEALPAAFVDTVSVSPRLTGVGSRHRSRRFRSDSGEEPSVQRQLDLDAGEVITERVLHVTVPGSTCRQDRRSGWSS